MRSRAVLTSTAIFVATGMLAAACGSDADPDPMKAQQWALNSMKLPDAWKDSKGEDITIAVVDTGTDVDHPDLKDHVVAGHDFVDNDDDPKDQNGHGTHVSGIAAAVTDNGVGIAGGAPKAKIMPVRVLGTTGSGDNQTITKGIVWAADHGAKVINLSLGESGLMSRLLKGGILNQAFKYVNGKGAVVVAAAGNDSTIKQPYKLDSPVLVVGAGDQNGNAAPFSNFGAANEVSAPGVHILSTLPTYKTQETLKNTSGYGYLDGTSMAAPYVSALAALLMAQDRTPAQTMQVIRDTAKNPSKDLRLGLGNVDAAAAVSAPKS